MKRAWTLEPNRLGFACCPRRLLVSLSEQRLGQDMQLPGLSSFQQRFIARSRYMFYWVGYVFALWFLYSRNQNKDTACILLLRTLLASWERKKRGLVVNNVMFLLIGLNKAQRQAWVNDGLWNFTQGRAQLEAEHLESTWNIIDFSDVSEVTFLNLNTLQL